MLDIHIVSRFYLNKHCQVFNMAMYITSQESDEELLMATKEMERFPPPVTKKDLDNISQSAVPINTRKRNNWAVKTFEKWSIQRNNRSGNNDKILKPLEAMTDEEIKKWLGFFVVEVRKEDGSLYPGRSVLSLVMGIQAHLRLNCKKTLNIMNDNEWQDFRQILDGIMKCTTAQGVGIERKQADVITTDQEEMFWKTKKLGDYNPKVLLRTLVFLNGKNFALRSGEEHRRLRLSPAQIVLVENETGDYLKYTEDVSKSNQGGLRHRMIKPKIVTQYKNKIQPERCHVRIWKKYMEMCPKINQPKDALYLQPLQNPTETVWYSRNRVGHNTLGQMVAELCKEAGLYFIILLNLNK
jgi:hypothetical protein